MRFWLKATVTTCSIVVSETARYNSAAQHSRAAYVRAPLFLKGCWERYAPAIQTLNHTRGLPGGIR